jgi:hypothetical protein
VIKLTSIDNWDELLDSPSGAGVVRANSNWIARLAATVTALQKGHPVCVIKGDACWECIHADGKLGGSVKKGQLQPNLPSNIYVY